MSFKRDKSRAKWQGNISNEQVEKCVHIYIYVYIQHNLWVKKHITIITANYLELIGKMPFVSEFKRPRAVFKTKLQLSMLFFKKLLNKWANHLI